MIKIDENQDKDVTYENEPESQRQLFPNIPLTVDVSPLQDAIDALDERMDDAESDIDSIMTTLQTFDGQPGVAETVSDMIDTNKIYVYVGSETGYTSGDWYYYDGTAWVSGGAYVANPVQIDDTLTQSGEAADAKATGDEIAQLKSDFDALEDDIYSYENLFYFTKSSEYINGITETFSRSRITLNGTASSAGSVDNVFEIHGLKPSTTYTLRMFNVTGLGANQAMYLRQGNTVLQIFSFASSGANSGPNGVIFTTPSDISGVYGRIYFNGSTGTLTNAYADIMVVEGSTKPSSYVSADDPKFATKTELSTAIASAINTLGGKCLQQSNAEFSTIGNANVLPANKSYLVYGHDVVSGSNLPADLAGELDAWPAVITTLSATTSRGYQLIVSTNNIFFRTVAFSGGSTTSGSTWRTIPHNGKISQMIADMTSPVPPYADYENFYSTANGAFLAKQLTTNSIDVTPSNVYGAHESGIYVYNNKIYLVCSVNKTDATEDQTKYNLELIKTALDGTIESSTKIVGVGDVIGSNEVTKCQAAFMLPVGGTIHIYCDVSISTGYKLYHLTYDTGTGEFSSFDEVYYVNKSGQTVKAEKNGEQYIASSWFSYSTHDYCTALYFNAQNAGIGYTEDFTTFNFIAFLEDGSLVGAGGEMSAMYASGFNKIVLVHRTKNDWSFLNMYQYDLTSSKWEPVKYIPDATARPMFFTYSGGIYLANNSPYSRQNVTIWKYLTSADGIWSNKGVVKPVSVAKLSASCTYFAFCVYNNEIYMSSIQSNLTKIKVSKIPLETVSNSDVNAKMIELFGT